MPTYNAQAAAGLPSSVAYAEITGNVSITATTEATATVVATAPTFTPNGIDAFWIEFYSPDVTVAANAGGNAITFCLYDGAASIGFIGVVSSGGTTALDSTVRVARKLIPTAAAHTYSIRAFRTNANCTVNAGVGGLAANQPAYINITRDV